MFQCFNFFLVLVIIEFLSTNLFIVFGNVFYRIIRYVIACTIGICNCWFKEPTLFTFITMTYIWNITNSSISIFYEISDVKFYICDPINLYPKFSYSLIVLCASDNLTLTSIFLPPQNPNETVIYNQLNSSCNFPHFLHLKMCFTVLCSSIISWAIST